MVESQNSPEMENCPSSAVADVSRTGLIEYGKHDSEIRMHFPYHGRYLQLGSKILEVAMMLFSYEHGSVAFGVLRV